MRLKHSFWAIFRIAKEIPIKIKSRSAAAVIAMNDTKSLNDTLELFAAGVDDVVRKPVHVREILARIKAISRRQHTETPASLSGRIRVFSDGRDPEIDGLPLPLPRRERRILEYLMANKGRRVTKSQIFNFVYGLFDDGIDENVIESPHQQAAQAVAPTARHRSNRLAALPGLPAHPRVSTARGTTVLLPRCAPTQPNEAAPGKQGLFRALRRFH